eukprot:1161159-Pelagomonas_calceolata.AAC.2
MGRQATPISSTARRPARPFAYRFQRSSQPSANKSSWNMLSPSILRWSPLTDMLEVKAGCTVSYGGVLQIDVSAEAMRLYQDSKFYQAADQPEARAVGQPLVTLAT